MPFLNQVSCLLGMSGGDERLAERVSGLHLVPWGVFENEMAVHRRRVPPNGTRAHKYGWFPATPRCVAGRGLYPMGWPRR